MNNDPAVTRAAEARALTTALAIADKANWSLEHVGPTLSAPYAGYLYSRSAELLLVPTSAGLAFASRLVDGAIREARADALVVSTAGDKVSLALALWKSGRIGWHASVMPLLDKNGTLWVVTGAPLAPYTAPAGTAFPLLRGRIVDQPVPWASIRSRAAGEDRATRWLEDLMV